MSQGWLSRKGSLKDGYSGPVVKASRESSLLFRLERGPGIALQAMQEKKALSSLTSTSQEADSH